MEIPENQHIHFKPEVTLVFLLYNAEKTVERLFQEALKQTHPHFDEQKNWLSIIFMDDFSKDKTVSILEGLLEKNPDIKNIQIIKNTPNLGLSRTINRACGLVSTPYLLTCHCDCFFGSTTYIYEILTLIKNHPAAAAITGKPTLSLKQNIPFFERFNTIANLMDVFPENSESTLIPVGFAEGRCDIFRLQALKEVGLYDTALRTSGEDQVLNAKLRELGYGIFLAPKLSYFISVSEEQNSLIKIAQHQRLFAQTSPYIIFSSKKSVQGLLGEQAGKNRTLRTFLRASQLFCAVFYLFLFILLLMGKIQWALLGIAFVFVIKTYFFEPYFRWIPTTFKEKWIFILFQPVLDFYYFYGFIEGLISLRKLRQSS